MRIFKILNKILFFGFWNLNFEIFILNFEILKFEY
jgi:hypothetical protein